MALLTASDRPGPDQFPPAPVRDLVLILTSRCNFACTYCYETGRSARVDMPWDVARAAMDLLFPGPPAGALLAFTGGEPLVAEPLFRRCVEEARARAPTAAALKIVASTNGALLTEDLVRFLASNEVSLQVSFDGFGQDLRSPASGPGILAALERAAEREPAWFRRRLRVALTLTPATLPLLGASVEEILRLGPREVSVAAVTAADWPAGAALEAQLDRQLDRVVAACLALDPEASDPPVTLLRPPVPRTLPAEEEAWCRAAAPESVAVDPDGAVWGCPSASTSTQLLSAAGRSISEAVHLGDVRDPDLPARLAALPARARAARALTHRLSKRSELAACDTCEHLLECVPCPLAAARVPGATDPDLVPAITCALTRAGARARARLPRRPLFSGLLRELARLSEALDPSAPPGS